MDQYIFLAQLMIKPMKKLQLAVMVNSFCLKVYLFNNFLFEVDAINFRWILLPDLFDGLSSPLLHLLYTGQVPHLRLKGQEPTPDLNGFLRGHLPRGQDSLVQDSSVVVLWKKIILHVFNAWALCTSQSSILCQCVLFDIIECRLEFGNQQKNSYSFYNFTNLK